MSTSLYDLSKMTKYELREVLAPIRDAVNKRVVAIKKANLPSPALKSLETSGGALSSKGKDKQALISEIQRGKAFINLKTGSVAGSQQFLKDVTKKQSDAERSGVLKRVEEFAPDYTELTDRSRGRYWETLHKLKQNGFQFTKEEYDTYNSLVRTAFKSRNPVDKLLDTIPAEAKDYILEHSDISEEKAEALANGLKEFMSTKSAMANDKEWNDHKLKGKDLDSYWAEKIVKMIEAYDDWMTKHPEFR